MNYRISFSWGGCRYARANEFDAAKEEILQASEATDSACELLDDSLKVVAKTVFNGHCWVLGNLA